MSQSGEENMASTVGGWLPADRSVLKNWVDDKIKELNESYMEDAVTIDISIGNDASKHHEYPLMHEEVRDLKKLIEEDYSIYILVQKMIDQAFRYDPNDPTGAPGIVDYHMMLKLIDNIMNEAPEYIPPDKQGHSLVGFPMNAILDWCMGTTAGFAFFLNSKVNEKFRNILNRWNVFLNSEESAKVLAEEYQDKYNNLKKGWMCKEAKKELRIEQFVYQEDEPHWGFQSWNDFFIRKFKEGQRPVAEPENPNVIVNACESAPYRIAKNIQASQKFWLKGQPYSIEYMLDQDPLYEKFLGGTLYQAFLSATNYHRWHSPVDGTIEKIHKVPGTYYSEIHSKKYDEAGPNNSQAFITQVATRAIIYIKSDNPRIGLMCFIAVGMAEVSTCTVTVCEGDRVKKGDELGYFQFGGSTHCLIFRKNVKIKFYDDAIPENFKDNSDPNKVNSKLAKV